MAYDYVIGMDVGKYFHHACVLDPQDRQLLPKHRPSRPSNGL